MLCMAVIRSLLLMCERSTRCRGRDRLHPQTDSLSEGSRGLGVRSDWVYGKMSWVPQRCQ